MPDEVRIIEVLSEVEGIGPVEWLAIDPARKNVIYTTIIPVLTHLPEGGHKICATGFDFCMN